MNDATPGTVQGTGQGLADTGDRAPEVIERRLRDSFARQTMMQTLGATLEDIGPGRTRIVAPIAPHVLQQQGFAHAAVSFAIGDSAAGYAALTTLPEGAEVVTAEMKIHLLSPAVGERLVFQKSKADWVQDRIKKGYEGDVEKLWETAQRQNAEAAAVKKLDSLIDAQRRQVAHHAGERWRALLDYLSGKLGELPEG